MELEVLDWDSLTHKKSLSLPCPPQAPWNFSGLRERGQAAMGWGVSRPSHLVTEQVLRQRPRGDFPHHQIPLSVRHTAGQKQGIDGEGPQAPQPGHLLPGSPQHPGRPHWALTGTV